MTHFLIGLSLGAAIWNTAKFWRLDNELHELRRELDKLQSVLWRRFDIESPGT